MNSPPFAISSALAATALPATPDTRRRPFLAWTLLALACVLAWDGSGLDLPMARWFGDSQGFALRDNWFMVHIAHEGARRLAWAIALGLALCIWWPVGPLRRIACARRAQLVLAALLSLAAMALIKRASATSCPWDLAEFGGVARHVSHWALGLADGGRGHCFPAGHASAGFGFLGGYFALAHHSPRAARTWLAAALLAGLALGLAQQMRGAHYMSHTLWTAWLCWTTGWLCDLATTRLLRRTALSPRGRS